MDKQYGHFGGGNEYIITTPNTPRHWYNYLWNDSYVAFASQVGAGEGFAQDDLGRRIPLVSGRQLYIADIDAHSWWQANALPVERVYKAYACTHRNGETAIALEWDGIASDWRLFVPREGLREIWSVTLANNSGRRRSLKLLPYVRTEMDGPYRHQAYNTDVGYRHGTANAAVLRAFTGFGGGGTVPVYGYLAASAPISGFDTRANAFIGAYGTEQNPKAMALGGAANSDCLGEKLCLSVENTVTLEPGESARFDYICGIAFSEGELSETAARCFAQGAVDTAREDALAAFARESAGVSIDTPDDALNGLFNGWLKHQTNLGSRWARVRHNGYRDMVSDSECCAAFNPELAWERFTRALTYQYPTGYAPRTFLDGTIRDNNFADCAVWIPMAAYAIVMESGDITLLEQPVKFNDGSSASVYEHVKRAVDFLWGFRGLHGLIRIWGGDWNDLMNLAGLQGKGVSVWLSIAWCRAAKLFAALAEQAGHGRDAADALARVADMDEIINREGWDGEHYLDAYNDWDEKIGSMACEEGKIFLIPQLWAVLADIGGKARQDAAMASVEKHLSRPLGTLVSWPSYHSYKPKIGRMSLKPAGVHENGGPYLHPMMWKLAADSLRGDNAAVQKNLEQILPWNHKWAQTCGEPYIICNAYFSDETGYRAGTPGQSWRTASGPWLLKALAQYVFGLQPTLEGLALRPCLPPDWRRCAIEKRFRGACYKISYERRGEGGGSRVDGITVNGEPHGGAVLPYEKGKSYDVLVTLASD